VYKASSFASSLPAIVVIITLDHGRSNWSEMKSMCCFDLISFTTRHVEHFFMYLEAICTYSFAHFFTGVLIIWGLSFLSSL
jgi:hypothetical protein